MTQTVNLGEVAFVNPKGPIAAELDPEQLCDFVPMQAVHGDGRIEIEETRPFRQVAKGYTPFRSGDVLVAKITPCFENGKIALAETRSEHAFGSTEFHVVRGRKGLLDSRYLLHFLRLGRIRFEGEERMTGSAGQKRVPRSFLDELEIPLPKIAEQQRITAILDKVDGIRRKREYALASVDDLMKSEFVARFGTPMKNTQCLPTAPIHCFGRVVTGNTPPRKNPENYGDAIEWIKSDNINTHSHFLTPAQERLSEVGKRLGRTAPAGSTLITCIAGSPSVIGNSAISDREVAFNQQINTVIPNDKTDPFFLYCQFLVGKTLIQASSTNSMKGMVSKGKFQEIEFLRPSYDAQLEFGELFSRAIAMTRRLETDLRASENLFGSLAHRAFHDEL